MQIGQESMPYRMNAESICNVLMMNRQVREIGKRDSFPTTLSAFIFTIRGKAKITFDKNSFLATRECVVHGAPGYLATFEPLGDEPYEHINIYYHAGQEQDGLDDMTHKQVFCFSMNEPDHTLKQLEGLEALNHEHSLDSRLSQIIGATMLIKKLLPMSDQNTLTARLDSVRDYLERHYDQTITLKMLGDMTGLSPKRLSFYFTKAYGISPTKYLIMRRMEKATSLLAEGALIKDVALQVGYEDPFYFSRLFKRYYGHSPKDVQVLFA